MNKMLSQGLKSSEFIILAVFAGYIFLSSVGLITPARIDSATATVKTATEAIPAIIQALANLASQFGEQTLLGALVWAYIRKRSGLKEKDLEARKLALEALIAKYKGIQK